MLPLGAAANGGPGLLSRSQKAESPSRKDGTEKKRRAHAARWDRKKHAPPGEDGGEIFGEGSALCGDKERIQERSCERPRSGGEIGPGVGKRRGKGCRWQRQAL